MRVFDFCQETNEAHATAVIVMVMVITREQLQWERFRLALVEFDVEAQSFGVGDVKVMATKSLHQAQIDRLGLEIPADRWGWRSERALVAMREVDWSHLKVDEKKKARRPSAGVQWTLLRQRSH